jgi:hypothetical protein
MFCEEVECATSCSLKMPALANLSRKAKARKMSALQIMEPLGFRKTLTTTSTGVTQQILVIRWGLGVL